MVKATSQGLVLYQENPRLRGVHERAARAEKETNVVGLLADDLPTEEPVSEDQEEIIDDTFEGGYISARWTTGGLLEWGMGFTRGVLKRVYGDAIPDKANDPIFVFGQKPGGLARFTGFYGESYLDFLKEGLERDGFTFCHSGKLGVHPRSHSGGKAIPRGVAATTGSFTARPKSVPFWRPEPFTCKLHETSFVVGDGFVDFNLPPDQTRINPHGQEIVRKPQKAVKLPTDLDGIISLAQSLGFTAIRHPVGVVIK